MAGNINRNFAERDSKKIFSDFDIGKILESECYKALLKIKQILDDDNLEDKECFDKIEEIVCVLESIGSNGGSRHDFG